MIRLHINVSPALATGNCTVNPEDGIAAVTTFTIECSGWKDAHSLMYQHSKPFLLRFYLFFIYILSPISLEVPKLS